MVRLGQVAPCGRLLRRIMASMSQSFPKPPRRPWLRFSLRFLLLMIVVIAIPLAWQVNRVQEQRRLVAEVRRLGGRVFWDHEWSPGPGQPSYRVPPGPKWLRYILGEDFFAHV